MKRRCRTTNNHTLQTIRPDAYDGIRRAMEPIPAHLHAAILRRAGASEGLVIALVGPERATQQVNGAMLGAWVVVANNILVHHTTSADPSYGGYRARPLPA